MRLLRCSLPLLLVSAGCAADPGDERLSGDQPPPAAAQIAPRAEAGTLGTQLERLLAELEAGMEGDPERLLRAEALTDGLMEAQRQGDWLVTGYDVEARLRQLQAMADRVVARLRRGAALADVADDVNQIARAANDLRGQLAAGGGRPAPPPLDSLLAQDPMRNAAAGPRSTSASASRADTADEPEPTTTTPSEQGPLGVPIPDG